MVLLTNIFFYPVLWWVIVPIALLAVFDVILVWESRIPGKKNSDKVHHAH